MGLLAAFAGWTSSTAAAGSFAARTQVVEDGPQRRMIVLTDMEADQDDAQSLVRLMLYANEVDIEGLVATTSTHMRHELHPETIRRILDAYAKVQPNLIKHDRRYPAAAKIFGLISTGQPDYGMAAIGTGKDTSGSNAIVRALESPDPRPLWVTVWGGPNTLAQALLTLKAIHSAAETSRLLAKLRVATISDQDDSGAWIRRTFPNLFYVVSPGEYGRATAASRRTYTGARVSLWRWRDDFQNDFAARIGWTTLPYEKANHPPLVRLAGPDRLTVHSDEVFTLSAEGTTDPDGDSLSYLWFNYTEAGTLKAAIPTIGAENIFHMSFKAPAVSKPETAHFILRVTDKGAPPLTRYKRVVVTILPN